MSTRVHSEEADVLLEAFLAKQRERNAAEDRLKELSVKVEIMAAEIDLKASQGTPSDSEPEL